MVLRSFGAMCVNSVLIVSELSILLAIYWYSILTYSSELQAWNVSIQLMILITQSGRVLCKIGIGNLFGLEQFIQFIRWWTIRGGGIRTCWLTYVFGLLVFICIYLEKVIDDFLLCYIFILRISCCRSILTIIIIIIKHQT